MDGVIDHAISVIDVCLGENGSSKAVMIANVKPKVFADLFVYNLNKRTHCEIVFMNKLYDIT